MGRAQVHESKNELAKAETSLKEIEKFGKDYEFYPMLSFKVAMVEKRLGLTAAEVYSEVCVAAGKAEEMRFVVDPKFNALVSWDFSVADYTIDFSATFELPSGETQRSLSRRSTRQRLLPSRDGSLPQSTELPRRASWC